MKIKWMFSVVVICLSVAVQAQNFEADSLKNLLKLRKEDTAKVLLLNNLARAYMYSKPDTSLLIGRQGLELARKIDYKKGEAISLRTISSIFSITGNYPAALEVCLQALKITEELNDEAEIGRNVGTLSDIYAYQGDYKRSITYARQALAIFAKNHDSVSYNRVLTNLGDTYENTNQLDSALLYATEGYRISMQLKNELNIGVNLVNLGNIYSKVGKTDSAIFYYRLSITNFLKQGLDEGLAETYLGLATVFRQHMKTDSSLYYAKLSYNIADRGGFTEKILEASNFLAAYYKSIHNIDSAYAYQQITITAKDSLFSQQKTNQIQSMTYDEAMRQQQIEDTREQARNQIRQNALLAGLVSLLIVAALLFFNNRQKRKANVLLGREKQKVESALSELKSTQAQLLQSEKMASLGELTAGIAHEIQNPLNFINNFSEVNIELIDEMVAETDWEDMKIVANDIRHNNEKIIFHGRRAEAIVKGMLQHSRQSKGVRELTNINKLCDEYLRLSYHGLRAKDKNFNADFKTSFDESISKISIITADIGSVLLNVFNNAFYAVNEKKKVTDSHYIPMVSIATSQRENGIEIKISDNGIGIPQRFVHKIFQPFFTTKPTGQGTGLGLSLAYDIIIKEHNGTIAVESIEGEGSIFLITLPL